MTASYLFAGVFYVATLLLVVGLAAKIAQFARTPAPLKIPTTPAPVTTGGMVFRMFREVALFESLFKSNLWIWAFGYMFHLGLALVTLRHLRYFVQPVPEILAMVQYLGIYGGLAMVAGLGGLLARRILVERIRYISTPSDYLWLVLLLGIGCSGLLMKFVAHTDIVSVKVFFQGWMRLNIQQLPGDPVLLAHLAGVAMLMILFPFSKLLHAPGVFFSPTRNQVDNPREVRHLAPWAAKMEAKN
ncbi:MAG: respiratory nitrate reductase subunit gamma [Rhodocyclaceae bacterium]|nr:respiratory nitrate reductase subunit gamma [Rhodocyclaceae bacterium]